MLVALDGGDYVVGNDVLAHLKGVIENNVLDGEVNEVYGVMNGQCYDGGVIIGKDSRDAAVQGLPKTLIVSCAPAVVSLRTILEEGE